MIKGLNFHLHILIRKTIYPLVLGGLLFSACAAPGTSQTITPEITTTGSLVTASPAVTGTATPIPSATVPVELSKLKGIEVTLIHPWSGDISAELRRIISEFNNENIWGIKVVDIQGGSVTESARIFTESMATSERINVIAISPEYLARWYNGGFTVDLSPYLSNSEWGISSKEKNTYLSRAWESNRVNDRQIGIPAQINLHFLVYNNTWAKELGFAEPPDTRDEFMSQVCEAARSNNQDSNRDNDGTGGWIINSSASTLMAWIYTFAGNKTRLEEPENAITAEETGEAFSYLRSLSEKGCAWSSRVASPFTYFVNRQTLSFSASLPDLLELEQTLKFGENTDEWSILPYPDGGSTPVVYGTGLSYGIGKTDDVRELASWLFLRWLTLPRNQARLAETSGTIPPTSAAVELMSPFGSVHPWWAEGNEMAQDAVFIQAAPNWQKARMVLEDGFWQSMQPTPMPIPTLLHQMDVTFNSFPE